MKRIIIICEGETEQEFCKKILAGNIASEQTLIQAPRIKHTHGGIVRWNQLKKQIELTLLTEPDAFVTTLIDYYGLAPEYKFPGWDEAEMIADKNARMDYLEQQMKADVDPDLSHRFIPYIQLHEFEGLLFCDVEVFRNMVPERELVGLQELTDTIAQHPNPEMINNAKDTSPSHRLQRIIKGYNKVVYGNILAETIGLPTIRSKCPRFNHWLTTLENL